MNEDYIGIIKSLQLIQLKGHSYNIDVTYINHEIIIRYTIDIITSAMGDSVYQIHDNFSEQELLLLDLLYLGFKTIISAYIC